MRVNNGPASSSQKVVDSYLACEQVYKPHVAPRFVLDVSVLPTTERPKSTMKGGVYKPIRGRHVNRPLFVMMR